MSSRRAFLASLVLAAVAGTLPGKPATAADSSCQVWRFGRRIIRTTTKTEELSAEGKLLRILCLSSTVQEPA